MTSKIKSIGVGLVLGLAALVGAPKAEAAQPIVWTATITNAVFGALAAGANLTITPFGNVVWTSSGGSVSTNYVDTLQQQVLGAEADIQIIAGASGTNGAFQFNLNGSQDLLEWNSWTNVTVAAGGATNYPFGTQTLFDARPIRYVALTNCTFSYSNSYVTNGIGGAFGTTNNYMHFRLFLKGP